jgi:hypothetical protein
MRQFAATDSARIVLLFHTHLARALVLALDVLDETSAEMAPRSPSLFRFNTSLATSNPVLARVRVIIS